ncbi:MAG: hypothetical protein V7K92_18505 [Nostoc sp.]|uniref:hypothetical protein n=1 Tax=Nostoc sp. TaxID=1180 RepID=UPI002FF41B6C
MSSRLSSQEVELMIHSLTPVIDQPVELKTEQKIEEEDKQQESQKTTYTNLRDFQLKKHPIPAGRSANVGDLGQDPLQMYK